MSESSGEAMEKRLAGNAAFQQKDYDLAITCYSEAIALTGEPGDPKLFGNRSAAKLGKGDAAAALEDAEKALELDPTWQKGYTRKAYALAAMEKHFAATRAYEEALEKATLSVSERTWFHKKLQETQKTAMKMARQLPVEDEDSFIQVYAALRDKREKLCTLARFWNVMTSPERFSAFQRFLEIMAGKQEGVEPPEGLTEERMTALPMDNYADLEDLPTWTTFFAELGMEDRLRVLERMWNTLETASQSLVVTDLKVFLLAPLLEERERAMKPPEAN